MKKPIWDDDHGIHTIRGENLRIDVHHYIGCGKSWFLSCPGVRSDVFKLQSIELNEAKKEALEIISNQVKQMLSDLEKFKGD